MKIIFECFLKTLKTLKSPERALRNSKKLRKTPKRFEKLKFNNTP